ncbi:glycerate kinase [Microbacterium sp. zg.Y909]|uniref:glycerate kinase n=1 Tax=Microbacterium sp. zg.Y909 TaxID=2969413 RepID=UPI00214B7E28|nr:glycerate kinase [Microbacterium sp. zg.Y909]MCR2825753.1 glycerate kinase [Microbacterium sp. zg.Y909]
MTVVVAIDSFKGSIAAAAAARAVADGWLDIRSEAAVLRPMADGGEGTLDAFAAAVTGAERMPVRVTGPDGAVVDASWLLLPPTPDAPAGTGVVELASTSGIELLGDRRLPWDADTTGFGQAIAAALDHGVSRLVLGIGSSASTDGGVGMLRALGAQFTDAAGLPIAPGARGLSEVAAVDLSELRPPPPAGALVLTDVTNPLLGPAGAAAVFGPQKGLDAAGVATADAGLARLAVLVGAGGGSDGGADGGADAAADPAAPGTGAAGGTGFGLVVWGARLVPGAPEVAELIGLREAVASADLVVTGEGAFDGQSAAGKVPTFVAALAAEAGVPVALVAGRIAADADTSAYAASVSLTALAGSPEASLAEPARWLRAAGAALARRA